MFTACYAVPFHSMLQFGRITTQKRFIPQIDGLRFVAISSVVFFHIYAGLELGAIPTPIPINTDLAKRGVELFHGISGFIRGVPFAPYYLANTGKVNLKQYFLCRLTRLEPPYLLSLNAWAAMQRIVGRRSLSDMAHLAATFVYHHNLIFGGFVGAVNTIGHGSYGAKSRPWYWPERGGRRGLGLGCGRCLTRRNMKTEQETGQG